MKPWNSYLPIGIAPKRLSIPLRMKPGVFGINLRVDIISLSIPLRMKHNIVSYMSQEFSHDLSIPLRMKHRLPTMSFGYRGESFNSFEDETYWMLTSIRKVTSLSFNSFEDETTSSWYRWTTSRKLTFNSFEDETDLLLFSLLYSRG